MPHPTRLVLGRDPLDHVAKKAEDRSFGHVDFLAQGGTQVHRRLDERPALRVEFENRISVGANAGSRAR